MGFSQGTWDQVLTDCSTDWSVVSGQLNRETQIGKLAQSLALRGD